MKKLIEGFLKKYAEKYYEMPDAALELLMDDHICVTWEGTDYFIPENNSFFTEDDDLIWKFLNECYHY
jgi:hypothetical protein